MSGRSEICAAIYLLRTLLKALKLAPTSILVAGVAVIIGAWLSLGVFFTITFSVGWMLLVVAFVSLGDPSRFTGHAHGFSSAVKTMAGAAKDGSRQPAQSSYEEASASAENTISLFKPDKEGLSLIQRNASNDLTGEECRLLQYFFSITRGLQDQQAVENTWQMTGGGSIHSNTSTQHQLSFTSLRYHLSFVAYSVSCLAMRTPLNVALPKAVLGWIMEQLLDRKVFGYWTHYWPQNGATWTDEEEGETVAGGSERHEEKANPFLCRENVMWTGHVLHVACLYERLTGDRRFRDPGGICVRDDDGKVWHTDALRLGLHLATCMRINACGGVPCEPGLVFFQCQNHPHCGLRLLEVLGAVPDGFFAPERERFLSFAASAMRAPPSSLSSSCSSNSCSPLFSSPPQPLPTPPEPAESQGCGTGSGGFKILVFTTPQSGPAFDEPYARERKALSDRLSLLTSEARQRQLSSTSIRQHHLTRRQAAAPSSSSTTSTSTSNNSSTKYSSLERQAAVASARLGPHALTLLAHAARPDSPPPPPSPLNHPPTKFHGGSVSKPPDGGENENLEEEEEEKEENEEEEKAAVTPSPPPVPSPSVVRGFTPLGHPGSDAWDLLYLHWWAESPHLATAMYHEACARDVREAFMERAWACPPQLSPQRAEKKTASSSSSSSSSSSPPPFSWSPPPSPCCGGLNISLTTTTAALSPVLAQCQDTKSAEAALAWLKRTCRVSVGSDCEEEEEEEEEGGKESNASGGRLDGSAEYAVARKMLGKVWLAESPEWSIGNTANFAMAVSMMRGGSDPRRLYHTQRPPLGGGGGGAEQGDSNEGSNEESSDFSVALVAVSPPEAAAQVFRCRRPRTSSSSSSSSSKTEGGAGTPSSPPRRSLEIGLALPAFGPSVKLYLAGFGSGVAHLEPLRPLHVNPQESSPAAAAAPPTSPPPPVQAVTRENESVRVEASRELEAGPTRSSSSQRNKPQRSSPSSSLNETAPLATNETRKSSVAAPSTSGLAAPNTWTWREVPGGVVVSGGQHPTLALFRVTPRTT